MINEEKKKALEAALGHIEKQYGKGSVMKLGELVDKPFRQFFSESTAQVSCPAVPARSTHFAICWYLPYLQQGLLPFFPLSISHRFLRLLRHLWHRR